MVGLVVGVCWNLEGVVWCGVDGMGVLGWNGWEWIDRGEEVVCVRLWMLTVCGEGGILGGL